jgi:hypothetical protein
MVSQLLTTLVYLCLFVTVVVYPITRGRLWHICLCKLFGSVSSTSFELNLVVCILHDEVVRSMIFFFIIYKMSGGRFIPIYMAFV